MLRLVLQLTKGIVRDSKARRNLMFYIMITALVMLSCGVAFLSDQWGRDYPFFYIGYWIICAWITLTAMLLAVFDILLIRAADRVRRRQLEKEIIGKTDVPKWVEVKVIEKTDGPK